MTSLSLILRLAAIFGAVLSTVLYFVSEGKIGELEQQLVEARDSQKHTAQNAAQLKEQIDAANSELAKERGAAAKEKRGTEGLRAELFTARQEVNQTRSELIQAKEKINELEAASRRLRESLVESEKNLARPSIQPQIENLNRRIQELEKTNLQLTLRLANQQKHK